MYFCTLLLNKNISQVIIRKKSKSVTKKENLIFLSHF